MAKIKVRQRSGFEIAQDSLVADFNTVYRLIDAQREAGAKILADATNNVWTRKKALDRVLNAEQATKALIRIIGGLEDAMEQTGFVPAGDYTLEDGNDE